MSTSTELLSTKEKPNAEIACDLTDAPDTLDERFAEYGRLFQHALIGRQRTAGAVELKFAAKAGVAEWLADLARREATCCPFLSHHVSSDGTHVTWKISSQAGGPEAQFTLDEYHDLPERFRDGIKGHVERAAARGFKVDIRGSRRLGVDDGNHKTGPMSTSTELLSTQERPSAEIACDLTDAPDTPEERLAEYGRLFQHALAGRERSADAVEFKFGAKPGVAEWVADLARREAACCPFLAHHVSSNGTHITWRASSQAGPAAQATLDEFHDLPEQFGDGFKGLLERLAARGFTVSSPAPRRFEVDDGKRKPGVLDRLKAACGC